MGFLEMALRAVEELKHGERKSDATTETTKAPAVIQSDAGLTTTKTTKAPSVPKMPPGVTLIAWNPKQPPVGISYCAVVNDVEGFIADTLTQLGKLLDSRVGRRGRESCATSWTL
jgi:hypothetical protein